MLRLANKNKFLLLSIYTKLAWFTSTLKRAMVCTWCTGLTCSVVVDGYQCVRAADGMMDMFFGNNAKVGLTDFGLTSLDTERIGKPSMINRDINLPFQILGPHHSTCSLR